MRLANSFLFASLIASLIALVTPVAAHAADNGNTNLLAVGQGVSSPTSTSTINYSSGWTSENPNGVIYQKGVRLSAQYDQDNNNSAKRYGGEIGYGAGKWGVAAGYQKRDCENCESTAAGALGIDVSDFAFGIRFGKDLYSAGILINPTGESRFGVTAELNEANKASKVSAFGVGYSYVASSFTFAVDASKRQYENSVINDNRILITPGLMVRADFIQISVNDRIWLNSATDKSGPGNETVHDFWFGIGVGKDSWHLAFYSDYVNEMAAVGTLFF